MPMPIWPPLVAVSVRPDDFRRGAHRDRADDEAFIYVPCLNRSKAHLKVLTAVLAPYVGDTE